MAAPVSESELFVLGALAAEVKVPEVAAAASKEVASKPAEESAAIAPEEPAQPIPPAEPVATSPPTTTSNPPTTAAAAATPTTTPAPNPITCWAPRNRNLGDVADPLICPGLNRDCFHAMLSDGGYWDHIARKHRYSRKQMDKPANAWVRDIFVPARRASWFLTRGVDITYQGSEPKQIAARRRMALGIKRSDPGYARMIYGSTMTKADV